MKPTRPELVGCLLLVAATSALAENQERWGVATQGLQLALSPVRESWTGGDDAEFRVTLESGVGVFEIRGSK